MNDNIADLEHLFPPPPFENETQDSQAFCYSFTVCLEHPVKLGTLQTNKYPIIRFNN